MGKAAHKGAVYAGEHAAIVEPEVWERVNAELRAAQRGASPGVQSPQSALLKGLLYCGTCARPMAATYSWNGVRRYRYYVCRAGRLKGRNGCAAKFIAARAVEESVIEQVRRALSAAGAREQLHISETEWQALADNASRDFIRAMVHSTVRNCGFIQMDVLTKDLVSSVVRLRFQ